MSLSGLVLGLGGCRCPLCLEPVESGQLIMNVRHFIADEVDPFHRYSDTTVHVVYFLEWDHRTEFAARYEARFGHRLTAWIPAVRAEYSVQPDST